MNLSACLLLLSSIFGPFAAAYVKDGNVVQVQIGLPRLAEFVEAGKKDAAADAAKGNLRFLQCIRPGFHPPPEIHDIEQAVRDEKTLLKRYQIRYSNDLQDVDGSYPAPEYLCPYAESYNCAMLDKVTIKHGSNAARLVWAPGLPCR